MNENRVVRDGHEAGCPPKDVKPAPASIADLLQGPSTGSSETLEKVRDDLRAMGIRLGVPLDRS